LHWVAAADYARLVSNSYQTDETLNKELFNVLLTLWRPKAAGQ